MTTDTGVTTLNGTPTGYGTLKKNRKNGLKANMKVDMKENMTGKNTINQLTSVKMILMPNMTPRHYRRIRKKFRSTLNPMKRAAQTKKRARTTPFKSHSLKSILEQG